MTPSPPSTRPSGSTGRRSSAFVRERHAPIDARGRPALSRSAGYVLRPLTLDVERAPYFQQRERKHSCTQPIPSPIGIAMTNGITMTNGIIESIVSRSTTKHYDPAVTLSDDQIRELVRIGTTAPTSFHLQNWRF